MANANLYVQRHILKCNRGVIDAPQHTDIGEAETTTAIYFYSFFQHHNRPWISRKVASLYTMATSTTGDNAKIAAGNLFRVDGLIAVITGGGSGEFLPTCLVCLNRSIYYRNGSRMVSWPTVPETALATKLGSTPATFLCLIPHPFQNQKH